jgi:8-oxo-dGTP pyrophosphatase MutT (NUDIX family)
MTGRPSEEVRRIPRHAVRVAILDPSWSIFLLRYDNQEVGVHWAMPGGGIEEGETLLDAARREVLEETGWSDVDIGVHVWSWEHDFTHRGRPVHQFEKILLGSGRRREPKGDLAAHVNERILEWRWWPPDELRRSPDALWPPDLSALLDHLRENGPPSSPTDITHS